MGVDAGSAAGEVREVIERWAVAVQDRDLDGVLAHHDDDIVMFDVPPPERGVQGMDAYRASWIPFFEWVQTGARFEIDELHVDVDGDLAFAWALLWCGTDEDLRAEPDRRLRLSLGLRRRGGSWVVVHEHHSFALR